jgi:hypothetical protein
MNTTLSDILVAFGILVIVVFISYIIVHVIYSLGKKNGYKTGFEAGLKKPRPRIDAHDYLMSLKDGALIFVHHEYTRHNIATYRIRLYSSDGTETLDMDFYTHTPKNSSGGYWLSNGNYTVSREVGADVYTLIPRESTKKLRRKNVQF